MIASVHYWLDMRLYWYVHDCNCVDTHDLLLFAYLFFFIDLLLNAPLINMCTSVTIPCARTVLNEGGIDCGLITANTTLRFNNVN